MSRRRQIFAQQAAANQMLAGPPDCQQSAPEAVTNPSPPPVADSIVSFAGEPTGLVMTETEIKKATYVGKTLRLKRGRDDH